MLYFVRNRLVAAGAVAAAALSTVAGLTIGTGPIGQSVLSAQRSGWSGCLTVRHHDDDGPSLCQRGGAGRIRQCRHGRRSVQWLRGERSASPRRRRGGKRTVTTERFAYRPEP